MEFVSNDENVKRSKYPGLWREGILVEDNYVHNIGSEGMYIGPNYWDGGLPLRNIEIRYNGLRTSVLKESTRSPCGRVTTPSTTHEVRRAGKNTTETNQTSQYSGIESISGTVKIYNNWIETTGQHGISVWTAAPAQNCRIIAARFQAHIWNNVIVDAGARGVHSCWKAPAFTLARRTAARSQSHMCTTIQL
jgi:hypothetical protein